MDMNMKNNLFLALVILAFGCGDSEPASTPETTEEPAITKEDAAEKTRDGKSDFTLDYCKAQGWYGDGSCDWFCIKRDPDCNAEPLFENPTGHASSLPIVLTHGFNAGREGSWSFYKVEAALVADGHTVYVAEVPAFGSVEDRAASLAVQIDDVLAQTRAPKIHLIAHSMGGMDSRYVISSLGYGDRIATLTTISTPHRGTAVADAGVGLIPGVADSVINMLATLWSKTFNEVDEDANVRAALSALSTDGAARFNEENPDDPRVHYQSWAGVSSALGLHNSKDEVACQGKLLAHPKSADRMNLTLLPGAAVIAGLGLTPSDGMATVESAIWGDFKGCIPADHLDEVGQIKNDEIDPYTGFDHIAFYRTLAYQLAADYD